MVFIPSPMIGLTAAAIAGGCVAARQRTHNLAASQRPREPITFPPDLDPIAFLEELRAINDRNKNDGP